MEKRIQKFKLIKDGKKAEVDFHEEEERDGAFTCKYPVHPDLKKAIQALSVHLGCLCGYFPAKSAHKADLDSFVVTGITMGGSEDDQGITITGYKKVDKGVVILNTPYLHLDEKPESRYQLADVLLEALGENTEMRKCGLMHEIAQYLAGEKKGKEEKEPEVDPNQLPMDFGEGDEGEAGKSPENNAGGKVHHMKGVDNSIAK